MTRKKVFHHALMAAMHRRAVHNRGGPGRCRDWSSRFPRAGEPLPRFLFWHSLFVTYQTSVYVIGFLVMVKEGEKQWMTFRWNPAESIHITVLENEGGHWFFCRMPLALCARAATKATFKWHARTRLCATQIIKLRLSLLSLLSRSLSLPLPLSSSITGFRNSRAVCLCTSRCKYVLLSDWHPPRWPSSCPLPPRHHYALCAPYSATKMRFL